MEYCFKEVKSIGYPMTIFTRIIFFTIAAFICSQHIYGQLGSGVIFRGDTAFRSGDKTLFTGEYVDFAPDARVRGSYYKGLKDGLFKYYSAHAYPNKARNLDSIVNYGMGKRHGLKEAYHPGRSEAYIK